MNSYTTTDLSTTTAPVAERKDRQLEIGADSNMSALATVVSTLCKTQLSPLSSTPHPETERITLQIDGYSP